VNRPAFTLTRPMDLSRFFFAILLFSSLPFLACKGRTDPLAQKKFAQARQLEQDKEADKAYPIYEEVLTLAPCSDEAFFRLGVLDYIRNDYPRAGERFEGCVRCNRDHVLCWERLAWTREKLSQYAEAAAAYHEANRIRPAREFMDGEGQALIKAGKVDEASRIFQEVMKQYPDDHRAVYFMANIYLKKGNKEKARELYEKAIEMRPVLVEAYENLGSILFGEARYAEAATLMEKTFEAVPMDAPSDPELRYNIAICWFKAGDREQAEKHLRKYLKLAPHGKQAEAVKQLLKSLGANIDETAPSQDPATQRP
jgi:tetratricopeptide (TPR) repeat protein